MVDWLKGCGDTDSEMDVGLHRIELVILSFPEEITFQGVARLGVTLFESSLFFPITFVLLRVTLP